ncbi:YitT family protein [Ignavigranum ruoffiae]
MKQTLRSIFLVLLGSLIFAIALNSINIPNELGEGGVTGLTLLFYYTLGIKPALSNIIINSLVIFIGWKYLDRITIYYTFLSIFALSFFLHYVHLPLFIPSNTLLASVASGFLIGVGISLVIYGRGTTAGSDIIAMIMNKYVGISIPIALLMIDCMIVIPLTYAIGLEKGVLTVIALYTTSKIMNFLLEGSNPKRAFLIISDHHEEIAKKITEEINRGVTILNGYGYYSKKQRNSLYIVVNRFQILPTQKIIYDIDPRAFVTITDVQQVLGEGFSFYSGTEDQLED